jgi:hypothetical protein
VLTPLPATIDIDAGDAVMARLMVESPWQAVSRMETTARTIAFKRKTGFIRDTLNSSSKIRFLVDRYSSIYWCLSGRAIAGFNCQSKARRDVAVNR